MWTYGRSFASQVARPISEELVHVGQVNRPRALNGPLQLVTAGVVGQPRLDVALEKGREELSKEEQS